MNTPKPFESVLAHVLDPKAGPDPIPVVAWNSGNDEPHWWAGLPGSYINLRDLNWEVVGWTHLTKEQTSPQPDPEGQADA